MPELKAVDCTTFDLHSIPAPDSSLRDTGREIKQKKNSRHAVGVAVQEARAPDKVLLVH